MTKKVHDSGWLVDGWWLEVRDDNVLCGALFSYRSYKPMIFRCAPDTDSLISYFNFEGEYYAKTFNWLDDSNTFVVSYPISSSSVTMAKVEITKWHIHGIKIWHAFSLGHELSHFTHMLYK